MSTSSPGRQIDSAGGNGRPSKIRKPARIYSCSICPKTFKRSEHCSRHERGHTSEKPFPCRHCGRRYGRKDLVKRHEQSFHPFELTQQQRPSVIETTLVTSTQTSNIEPLEEPTSPRGGMQSLDPGLRQPDEQIAASQRSPPVTVNAETNMLVGASPHNTEDRNANILEELLTAIPSPLSTSGSSSGTDNNQPQFRVQDDRLMANLLNDVSDHSKQVRNSSDTPIRNYEASQMGPDVQPWDSNQSSWQNPDILTGHQLVGGLDTVPNMHTTITNSQMEGYFQEVDFFSLLPNGGGNLETNFGLTDYLFNSGFSPPNDYRPSRVLSNVNAGNDSNTTHNSLSVATEAVAEAHKQVTAPSSSSLLPTVVYDTPRKSPFPVIEDDTYSVIQEDVKKILTPDQLKDFRMPNAQGLQRFLTSYFTCFHKHFPILHIPSLELRRSPSHLILSMCAIGAIYRLSRKSAKDLWFWANTMAELDTESMSLNMLSPIRIAAVQCKLLLSLFAVFGEDASGIALTKLGFWMTEYRTRRAALSPSLSNIESLSWDSWSLREASKRILYGTFIMSSLMTVTYDVAPGFSVMKDIDLEMPDEEQLWEATSAQQWEELVKPRTRQVPITVRDAMTHVIFAKELSTAGPDVMNWGAFARTVILHAVNIHMWHIMQFTQSFTAFSINKKDDTDLRARLGSQVEMSLGRCYNLLTADRAERERTSDEEGPLVSNCLALLRSAYVRAFTGAGSFNRMLLMSNDTDQIASSIQSYVAGPQERNQFLTMAVSKAYGGLHTPIKAGYLLVRKTAALSWSVEHAVAGWDCALFATRWIHEMELQQQHHPPNVEEAKNLTNFRELLTEVDGEYDGKGSLAAEISRVWACFLDDTWVWGVTPRMGHVLRQLSAAYTDDWSAKFPNGNENGPISR
ncbi:hypothetical protein V496_02589 [Pseudogymnoascus sp. VKM F-4515 (FW-2607)]|nr:hypothetical protein V496_02589 [Pseudogymnoascus sp. VKM F-4515 (FW-2607)]